MAGDNTARYMSDDTRRLEHDEVEIPSPPFPNANVLTVQQAQEMLNEALEAQRLELGQQMNEMRDDLMSRIRSLELAISSMSLGHQGRVATDEAGGSSQTAAKMPRLTGTYHQNSPRPSPQCFKSAQPTRAQRFPKSRPNYTCNRCGDYHKGRCPVNEPVCYKCKEPGHVSSECPQRDAYCTKCGQQGHRRAECRNRPHTASIVPNLPEATRTAMRAPDRAFHITAMEAPDASDAVRGTFSC